MSFNAWTYHVYWSTLCAAGLRRLFSLSSSPSSVDCRPTHGCFCVVSQERKARDAQYRHHAQINEDPLQAFVSDDKYVTQLRLVQLRSQVVSHLLTIFFRIYVGNTNAFKYGGSYARSGQFNGIADIFFSNQKVRLDLNTTRFVIPQQALKSREAQMKPMAAMLSPVFP